MNELERRYIDNNGWGPWESVSREEAREKLGHMWRDINGIMEQIDAGETIYTGYAEYRMKQSVVKSIILSDYENENAPDIDVCFDAYNKRKNVNECI